MDAIVEVANETGERIPQVALVRAVKHFAKTVRAPALEISLAFVSPYRMARLNATYRRVRQPTDVLSYRLVPPRLHRQSKSKQLTPLVGQLIFCPAVIRKRVKLGWYARPYPDCLTKLAAHGFLHIVGYDHQRTHARRRMEKMERRLLKNLMT